MLIMVVDINNWFYYDLMKVMVIRNIVFLGNVNVMFIKLIIVVYIYIICIKKWKEVYD